MSANHAAWIDPDTGVPGALRVRCRRCPFVGPLVDDLAEADAQATAHDIEPDHTILHFDTGPYPGAPRAPITLQAARILGQLVENHPTPLHTVSDGVAAVALQRRGLAIKEGGRGWRRTARGTAWAAAGRTR